MRHGRSRWLDVARCVLLAATACSCLVLASTAAASGEPTWLAPVNLSTLGQGLSSSPQVALDTRGNAFAVWEHSDAVSDTTIVETALRPAGGSWQAPVELTPPGAEGFSPQIAVDPAGDAIAAWRQSTGSDSNQLVEASERPAGGNWQAPVEISGPQNTTDLELAVGSGGEAIAVWDTFENGDVVQAAAHASGRAWQTPVTISPPGQRTGAFAPQVAVDAHGEAVVVWESGIAQSGFVQAAVRPAGGHWQAATDISGEGVGRPHVGIDADGEAVAVWNGVTSADDAVQSAAHPAAGSWQAPVELSTAGEVAAFSQVAVDAQGNATALWYDESGGVALADEGLVLVGASRPAGASSWHAPVAISAPSKGQGGVILLGPPAIAVGSQGSAVALWNASNGSDYVAQGAVRPTAAAPWPAPVDLSASGENAGDPQVAMNPLGNAIAVWDVTGDAINNIVQGAAYETPRPPHEVVSSPPPPKPPLEVPSSPPPPKLPPVVLPNPPLPGPPLEVPSSPPPPKLLVPPNLPLPWPPLEVPPIPTLSISGVSLTHARFRASSRGSVAKTREHAPLGTTFHFSLSVAAELTIAIARVEPGSRQGARCVPPGPVLRGDRAGRCSRRLAVGTVTGSIEPSRHDRLGFSGRIGARTLPPGNYEAALTAADASERSLPIALTFTIVH